MNIDDSISILKDIGEKRTQSFNAVGIFSVKDIIEYFPRDYEDRSVITPLADCCPDSIYTIRAKISGAFETLKIKQLSIIRVRARDESGEIELVWFNQPYLKNYFKIDYEYAFTGKITERLGKLQMESPDYEVFSDKELLNAGRIIPVYSTIGRLSQKNIRAYIKNALDNFNGELQDFLPNHIKKEYGICDRSFAINNIHFPKDGQAFFEARKRLVFEELLILQMVLFNIKGAIKKEKGISIDKYDNKDLLDRFPFSLTNAQQKVIGEIENDMQSGYVMNRLVQGDVGSGKTAVAMVVAYSAICQGYQVALMAPTEVLASQHYQSFTNMFGVLGINTVLLSGNLKKKEKLSAYEDIETGKAQMVIGTHALIEDGVIFRNLGLAITDEQHRFGVRQRAKLSDKGNKPNVLVMSATPIPRTLALIMYGDLDISIIDELPPGREKIETYGVNKSFRDRIYSFIKKEIISGRQIYIICPTIEESINAELKSVLKHTEEIKEYFNEYNVDCLHGKMKNTEKQDIMERFSVGDTDILISTTVIEVGINVPNATVMFIENAERFGLSQLHQLRGRVGRGSEKSYCILMSDSKSKITKERIKAMTSTTDGFKLSELDLKLRGPGDYFGTRQHGLPEFKIANLYKDMEILKLVQKIAEKIMANELLEKNAEYFLFAEEIKKYTAINQKISL